ncbi:hypothetical protein C0V78_06350 [Novosphingobium sp. TH158]|nr:hypothetical protein C0V78_06350 [Novosphingobium sp. TH158]
MADAAMPVSAANRAASVVLSGGVLPPATAMAAPALATCCRFSRMTESCVRSIAPTARLSRMGMKIAASTAETPR